MSDNHDEAAMDRTPKVVELKLPLTWLLSSAVTVVIALAAMYWNVDRLIRDVADLQILVRSGNTQSTTMAGQIELLKFRVDTLETSRRANRD